MVLKEEGKTPVAHVKEFRDNDVLYVARAWCENQNYWTLYFDVMDSIKPTFKKKGISLYYPELKYCTDNAAMIASCGYYEFMAGKRDTLDLNAYPSLQMQ